MMRGKAAVGSLFINHAHSEDTMRYFRDAHHGDTIVECPDDILTRYAAEHQISLQEARVRTETMGFFEDAQPETLSSAARKLRAQAEASYTSEWKLREMGFLDDQESFSCEELAKIRERVGRGGNADTVRRWCGEGRIKCDRRQGGDYSIPRETVRQLMTRDPEPAGTYEKLKIPSPQKAPKNRRKK
jgi:hypothetical protein